MYYNSPYRECANDSLRCNCNNTHSLQSNNAEQCTQRTDGSHQRVTKTQCKTVNRCTGVIDASSAALRSNPSCHRQPCRGLTLTSSRSRVKMDDSLVIVGQKINLCEEVGCVAESRDSSHVMQSAAIDEGGGCCWPVGDEQRSCMQVATCRHDPNACKHCLAARPTSSVDRHHGCCSVCKCHVSGFCRGLALLDDITSGVELGKTSFDTSILRQEIETILRYRRLMLTDDHRASCLLILVHY